MFPVDRSTRDKLPRLAVWLLAALGVSLRLAQYMFNRSLWWDEAMITLNILQRDYAGLLLPLDYFQGAPIGFLWAEKLATQVLGNSEYALRLFPLLAGSLSMVLFAWLAWRLLPGFEAAIVVAAFAISDPLIFYSAEVKQYAGDVLAALLIYAATLRQVNRPLTPLRTAGLATLGALLIWFSHAAIFVLAAAALALLLVKLRAQRHSRAQLAAWTAVAATWSATFGIAYAVSLRKLGQVDYLLAYWRDQGAFAPADGAVSSLDWLGGAYLRFFANPTGLAFTSLAAALFLLGCAALILDVRHGTRSVDEEGNDSAVLLALLLGPILLALAASWLGRYPFKDRLILFLAPSAMLLIGFGLLRLRQIGGQYGYWVAGVAAALLLAQPAVLAAQAVVSPRTGQEFRAAFDYMNPRIEAGDVVYVYERTGPQALYYLDYRDMRVDEPAVRYVFGTSRRGKWENHQAELDSLLGLPRVWVLFPTNFHVRDGLEYLAERGELIDTHQQPGVEILLYDLAGD